MVVYENIISEYQNPLKIDKEQIREYLWRVFEYHLSHTPYWKKQRSKFNLEEIFEGSLEEIFEKIFNQGLFVEEEYLRNNWLEFLPENYNGKIRFYQSSGTTGERAIGHWDYEYVKVLVKYLKLSFDEVYKLNEKYDEKHKMRAIAHGPYGWYQEEISELVWSYSGLLYFIGFETDGIKRELYEKGLEYLLRGRLAPLVKYTRRVLEKDKINTIRSAPPLLDLFLHQLENIETIILSGLEITIQYLKELQEEFPNGTIIPLYGHYAFGDLVGMVKNNDIVYYPNYPFTIALPLVKEDNGYRVVKYRERGKMALVIARPEILIIKIENEEITRIPPTKPFAWDGFANPKRGGLDGKLPANRDV
ncbi:hypothetical protein NF865_08315 [Thermococcus aggregans]|uniref:Uncharacterized protein n=1 Tax=Thermococcus aggregans TaxID=110163 RepID=A0A9E7SNZ5_THEAG|nr:hypothetical protein [Thermococcus aggregans]USS40317.1 hypothetical protein NF865_08315 [Thermococcus aggregans]